MLAAGSKICCWNRHPPSETLRTCVLGSINTARSRPPFARKLPSFGSSPRQAVMGLNEQPSGLSRLLQGIHGVQLVGVSTYVAKERLHHTELEVSTAEVQGIVGPSHRLAIRRRWKQRPSCLAPLHCGHHIGDQSIAETVANVVTSLPFIILGIQAPRKNMTTSLYANSLIGVGIVSSLYHSSRGPARRFLRWADYTMIAASTVCLSRALRNENPKLLMAASTMLLPFQPLMVSALHTGLLEVAFARRASIKPELKMAHNLHTASSLVGGILFVADDLFPRTAYIHAGWHLAAAIGVGTCNKLLE